MIKLLWQIPVSQIEKLCFQEDTDVPPPFSAYRVKETGTIFSYIICPNYSSIQNISNMNDNKTNQRLRSANENKEREKTLDAYAKKK